jgi:hypothetical protein
MSNLTIFKQPGAVSTSAGREQTALSKSMAQNVSMRRIQTGTNGTFKRIINGEQVGNAIRGEFNCIIVSALPKVSRSFYAGAYDPNAKATLPDCWSNLGDKPEAAAKNPQGANCAVCPQNIKGSGSNGGRACRYERRVAVLLEGGSTSETYQFKIPSKSLFGQGVNNVHPFESYIKFLIANGENPDTVVTNVSYDLNADTMALLFTPVRGLTDEEYALVLEAQQNPETERYIQLVAAPSTAAPALSAPSPTPTAAPAPTVQRSDEPDDEEEVMAEPVKRSAAKAAAPAPTTVSGELADIVSAWGSDD